MWQITSDLPNLPFSSVKTFTLCGIYIEYICYQIDLAKYIYMHAYALTNTK